MTLQDFLDKMKTIREKDIFIYEFDEFDTISEYLRIHEQDIPSYFLPSLNECFDNNYICKISSEQKLIASAFLKDKLAFAEVDRFIVHVGGIFIFLKFSEVQK